MKNMNHSFQVACFGGLNYDTGRYCVLVSLAFHKIRLNMKDMLDIAIAPNFLSILVPESEY